MGKHEGSSLKGFAELGAAFEDQQLAEGGEWVVPPQGEVPEPLSADTPIEIPDATGEAHEQYFDNEHFGIDEYPIIDGVEYQVYKRLPNNQVLIYRDTKKVGENRFVMEGERAISLNELEEGLQRRRKHDEEFEISYIEKKYGEAAAARVSEALSRGVSLSDAVHTEVERDKAQADQAVEAVSAIPGSTSGDVETPEELPRNEVLPEDGELDARDRPARIEQLNESVVSEAALEGEVGALENLGAAKIDIAALKAKGGNLNVKVREMLREVAPETLKKINYEDALVIYNVQQLLRKVSGKNDGEKLAKLKKDQSLTEAQRAECAAYSAAQSARERFVHEASKNGIPANIARAIFGQPGAAIEDKKRFDRAAHELARKNKKQEHEKHKAEVREVEVQEAHVASPEAEPAGPVAPAVPEYTKEDLAAPMAEAVAHTIEKGTVLEMKEKRGVNKEVMALYAKEGINVQELEAIPGFIELSEGQQLLMLKNYQSTLVGKVKREAKKEAEEDWSKRSFLGKMGLSMITLGVVKNVAEQSKQREIARKLASGDHLLAAERGSLLSSLARLAAEGPEVSVETSGALRLNYLAQERFKGDKEALRIVEEYNSAATKFAKIPKAWIDADVVVPQEEQKGFFAKLLPRKDTLLSGKEHREVAEAREEYQKVREQLLAVLENEAGGKKELGSRRKAMLELNGLDERVQLNQLFNADPDAEKALQDIRDSNVYTRAVSEFWKNRGQYMSYGIVTRIAATAALGAVALPAVAAISGGAVAVGVAGAVGYFQAKRETKELLKNRRASGVVSEEDLREEITYTADNRKLLEEREAAYKAALDSKDTERAKYLGYEVKLLNEKIKTGHVLERHTKQLKEFADAKFYTDRVNRLITKLDVAFELGDKESMQLIERKIAQTSTLMRELLKRGMVSFGQENRLTRVEAKLTLGGHVAKQDDAQSVLNSLEFMQALGHADAVVALNNEAIETKISEMVSGHREELDEAAKRRSNKHIAKAVKLRVGFGLAGYGLMHAGMNFFGGHEHVAHEAGGHAATHAPHAPGFKLPPPPQLSSHAQNFHDTTAVFGHEAAPAAPPHIEAMLGVHAVTHGETLTAIARKFPELAKLSPHEQDAAIANMVKHLSPAQLHEVGISSGNADLIRVGEHIDLDKLHSHLGGMKLSGTHAVHHEIPSHAHAGPQVAHEEHVQQTVVHHELPQQPVHKWVLPPKETISHDQHFKETMDHSSPEIAASVQNKFTKTLDHIFGRKSFFGRDQMQEWEGNSSRHILGLKDTSAEHLLTRRQGLIAESRTRMELRDYMRSLYESSHVKPKTGETADLYIRRALFEQEVATHKIAEAAAHAHEVAPIAQEAKSNMISHAAEVARVPETVHSTDEALEQVIPKLMKLPQLAHESPGVRENTLVNFLRDAQPKHFKALGLNGEEIKRFVGDGKVDAFKLAEYFKTHNADGTALQHAPNPTPLASK